MSATLGETEFFETEMTRLNGFPSVTVKSVIRPVPLEFSYAETPLAQTVETLISEGKGPVYVVHFAQADAAESAQDFTSLATATRDEKATIATALEGASSPVRTGRTSSGGCGRALIASRRPAAALPHFGRAVGSARVAEGHLRHGHVGRGH